MDKLIEVSTLQSPFLELSEKAVSGRRDVKFVMLEINEDLSQHNKNGITWVEQYVRKNIDTAINMSITAALIDGEMPTDHGFLEIQDGLPVFNASVIGHTYDAKIETLAVNGRNIKALVGYGLLDQMRFPRLISWIQAQIANGNPVSGSIEISSVVAGEPIGYATGYKEEGRQPENFCFSGFSLITVEPADPAAILIEMNSKRKEELMMDKEIEIAFNEVNANIKALNTLEAKTAELNSVKAALEQKTDDYEKKIAERNQIQVSLDAANIKIGELEAQLSDCDRRFQEIAAKCKRDELNAAIKEFSEADLASVKDLIDKFNADTNSVEVNTIVHELKAKKYDALAAELNELKKKPKDNEIDLMYLQNRKPLGNTDYSCLF